MAYLFAACRAYQLYRRTDDGEKHRHLGGSVISLAGIMKNNGQRINNNQAKAA